MRIVQVAGFYGPQSGGLRTCVDALGAGYLAAGLERVLVVPGPGDADELTFSGRRIMLRGPQIPASGGYRVITDRRRLASVVTDLAPDRLEVSDKLLAPFLGRLAGRLGVPALLLSHERLDGILAARLPGWFPRAAAADRWNRRSVDAYQVVVAASGWAAEEFERIGRSVVRSPLGVDLDTFRPDGAAARPEGQPAVLACITRLSAEKGPELAIDTLRALRRGGVGARLVMVGAGPMEEGLRRRAGDLPVTFTGHRVHRADVAGVLAGADVTLSCCPVESFGLAALESMACGTPVVIAAGGGGPELAAPGAAIVAHADPASFAAAAGALLADRTAARRAARARAEAFPWSGTVARMLAAHGVDGLQVAC